MTRDVVVVTRETPLTAVARIIAENGVSGLPVVDDERRVVGDHFRKRFPGADGNRPMGLLHGGDRHVP